VLVDLGVLDLDSGDVSGWSSEMLAEPDVMLLLAHTGSEPMLGNLSADSDELCVSSDTAENALAVVSSSSVT